MFTFLKSACFGLSDAIEVGVQLNDISKCRAERKKRFPARGPFLLVWRKLYRYPEIVPGSYLQHIITTSNFQRG